MNVQKVNKQSFATRHDSPLAKLHCSQSEATIDFFQELVASVRGPVFNLF
jgi:hypothetical protein